MSMYSSSLKQTVSYSSVCSCAPGPLYEYARKLFHEELKRFDVSAETCGKCFEQAGVSALLADDELFRREH
eukprot:2011923-Amphidinium_carterae.1